MDPTHPTDPTPTVPPALRYALAEPTPARRPWQDGVATAYIALFLWIAFLDRLAVRTLPVGGLGWSVLGAAAAGLLAYAWLYRAPALWGVATGRPLAVVGSATFGAEGSAWLPGVLMAVVQLAWFAAAMWYATALLLEGFAATGLIAPGALTTWRFGPFELQSPTFLGLSLIWGVMVAGVGALFVRLVAALNRVFPLFPALAIGGAMLLLVGGVAEFRPGGVDPTTGLAASMPGPQSAAAMIQIVFAFTATAGAAAVDWGAASRDARDVRLGGVVGVAVAPAILATVALLAVAGHQGQKSTAATPPPPARTLTRIPPAKRYGAGRPTPPAAPTVPSPAPMDAEDWTLRAAIRDGVGGRVGGGMLIVLGFASTAPACYAANRYARGFAAVGPARWPRLRFASLGSLAAWPLVATGLASKLDALFAVLGLAVAPILGALTADSRRHRGAWPGPRLGWNPPGTWSWVLGVAAGSAGMAAEWARRGSWPILPWSIVAYAVGYAAYRTLAGLGLESAPSGIEVGGIGGPETPSHLAP